MADSLFNPNQLSLPGPTDTGTMGMMQLNPDFAAYQNYFNKMYNPETGSDQLPGQWAAMTPEQKAAYSQSQAPDSGATGDLGIMAPFTSQIIGQPGISQQPTPQQQLNTPSFNDIAQTQPFQSPTPQDLAGVLGQYQAPAPQPLPMATQPPATQQLVQQLAAPTTPGASTSMPTATLPPATQQLISQLKKPTTPSAPVAPKPAPRQVFRPSAPKVPAPLPKRSFQAAVRQPARSVSKVNPPLLPSRPTGRR